MLGNLLSAKRARRQTRLQRAAAQIEALQGGVQRASVILAKHLELFTTLRNPENWAVKGHDNDCRYVLGGCDCKVEWSWIGERSPIQIIDSFFEQGNNGAAESQDSGPKVTEVPLAS